MSLELYDAMACKTTMACQVRSRRVDGPPGHAMKEVRYLSCSSLRVVVVLWRQGALQVTTYGYVVAAQTWPMNYEISTVHIALPLLLKWCSVG